MAVRVPLKLIVASSVPSPAENVRPVMEPIVSVPSVIVSDTRIGLLPASTSVTEIALKVAVENTSGVFCTVEGSNGILLTGASLTAVTVMRNVCGALVSLPPFAVPPLSFATMVISATPLALAAGMICNVPEPNTDGEDEKRLGLVLFVTTKLID